MAGSEKGNKDCIFCKIARKEINAAWVWEDDEFFAILDNQPNTKGMTLVLTKQHYSSYAFDMPDDVYQRLMIASKKVANLLDKKLNVKRTAMVMEGLGVNHAHVKLYPVYGLDEKFTEIWAKDKVYFEKYQGYITTQLGPQKSSAELEKTAKKIRS